MAIITNDQFAEFLNNKYSKILGYDCLPNDNSIFKYNHQALCYELGCMYYTAYPTDEIKELKQKADNALKNNNTKLNAKYIQEMLKAISKDALTLIDKSIMTDAKLHKAASILVGKLYNNYQSPIICLFQIAFMFKGLYIHDSLDNDTYNYWFGNELYQFQQALGIAPTDGFLIPQIEVLFSPTYFGMSSDSNQKLYDLQQKLNHFFSNYHTELSLTYGLLAPNGKDYQTSLYNDYSRTLNNAAIAFQIESGLEPTYWVNQTINGDLTIHDSQLTDLSKEFLIGVLNAYYNIESTDYNTALADFKNLKNISDAGLSDKTIRAIFSVKSKSNSMLKVNKIVEAHGLDNKMVQTFYINEERDQIILVQNTNSDTTAKLYSQKFTDFKKNVSFEKPILVLSGDNGGHTQTIQRASKDNPDLFFTGIQGNKALGDSLHWTFRAGLIDLSANGLEEHNHYLAKDSMPVLYNLDANLGATAKRIEIMTSLETDLFVTAIIDTDGNQYFRKYSLSKVVNILMDSSKLVNNEYDMTNMKPLDEIILSDFNQEIDSIQGYALSLDGNTIYVSSQKSPNFDDSPLNIHPRQIAKINWAATDYQIINLSNIKEFVTAVQNNGIYSYDYEFATELEGLQFIETDKLYQWVGYHCPNNHDRNFLFKVEL